MNSNHVVFNSIDGAEARSRVWKLANPLRIWPELPSLFFLAPIFLGATGLLDCLLVHLHRKLPLSTMPSQGPHIAWIAQKRQDVHFCYPPPFGATHLPRSVPPTFLDSSPVGGAVRKCNLLSICPVELSMGLGNSIPRFLPYLPSFEVSLGRVADCVHLSILWMCP
jgi:hypothetical protein